MGVIKLFDGLEKSLTFFKFRGIPHMPNGYVNMVLTMYNESFRLRDLN